MLIGPLILALALAWPPQEAGKTDADAPPLTENEYVYVAQNLKEEFFIQRENARGLCLGRIPLKGDPPTRIRPGQAGTILLAGWSEAKEIDRLGKTLFRFPLKGLPWEYASDMQKLPGGNYLILIHTMLEADRPVRGGGHRAELIPSSTVLEVDSKGQVIRRLKNELKDKARAWTVWPIGKDRLLVTSALGVSEVDWDGNEHFLYPLPGAAVPHDAMPRPNGDFMVAFSGPKGGVVERTRSGEEVWKIRHDCAISIQELPGGNILAGGG